MSTPIDLLWTDFKGVDPPEWPLGHVYSILDYREQVRSISPLLLHWNARLGVPDPDIIRAVSRLPGDVWHAGLRLGTEGQPPALDYVAPTWMFNADPDPRIEATSWRLSSDACLMRTKVMEKLGGFDDCFVSRSAAGLDAGLRYIRLGALVRHIPWMLGAPDPSPADPTPPTDESRLLRRHYSRLWAGWAAIRSGSVHAMASSSRGGASERQAKPYWDGFTPPLPDMGRWSDRISVIIPTLDRYSYLEGVLNQLSTQTVRPLEIIIVDQTERFHRKLKLEQRFPQLPLRILQRDTPGQCSSRNAGLEIASGDWILFLDDDLEIPADLIAKHAAVIDYFKAEASCGVADERGAGSLPHEFTFFKISPVFPTNNCLVSRAAVRSVGGFDLAFEKGVRADRDLGMRLYLSGKLLVLNPQARVFHYRATRGGLRQHRAREVTYAASRARVRTRHLVAPTEVYLGLRYFSERQVREALLLRMLGTLRTRGSLAKRIVGVIVGFLLMPHTWLRTRRSLLIARRMLESYPRFEMNGGSSISKVPESGKR